MKREPSPAMQELLAKRQRLLDEHGEVDSIFWVCLAFFALSWAIAMYHRSMIAYGVALVWIFIGCGCSLLWARRLRILTAEIARQATEDDEELAEQRRAGFSTRLREIITPKDRA